jgi:hypothetical protein
LKNRRNFALSAPTLSISSVSVPICSSVIEAPPVTVLPSLSSPIAMLKIILRR